jgi:hypothetical protein
MVQLWDPLTKRRQHIGYFATEEDAARAYDCAAVPVLGQSAKRNFPGETISELPAKRGRLNGSEEVSQVPFEFYHVDGCIALLGKLVYVAAQLVELDGIEGLLVAMLEVMLDQDISDIDELVALWLVAMLGQQEAEQATLGQQDIRTWRQEDIALLKELVAVSAMLGQQEAEKAMLGQQQ